MNTGMSLRCVREECWRWFIEFPRCEFGWFPACWARRLLSVAAGSGNTVQNPTCSYRRDSSQTSRGFTGHEELDDVALVHMNGRVYDPLVGRMISADPTVPDPMNAQS